jgi:hypothetical protein
MPADAKQIGDLIDGYLKLARPANRENKHILGSRLQTMGDIEGYKDNVAFWSLLPSTAKGLFPFFENAHHTEFFTDLVSDRLASILKIVVGHRGDTDLPVMVVLVACEETPILSADIRLLVLRSVPEAVQR